ncbi:MAG: class I SAM-dependent methyltransferase [Steroidobacteraceae bacterium]
MSSLQILFEDGRAYERYMGVWSQSVGNAFLNWLACKPGQRWLDVGCGNGAFTELVAQRCAPAQLTGIDPSEAQLRHARMRPACRSARFEPGGALSLPFADAAFDVAVMPLVIFFVPDPGAGVAEMKRVVGSGGIVSAYSWDMLGGGFPYAALHEEMEGMGVEVPRPPSPEASQMETSSELWSAAGLSNIETKIISVQRTYASFDEYWQIVQDGPSAGRQIAAMSAADQQRLKARLRARLESAAGGAITCSARANAIKGHV